jgi:DNA-binding IclR family transcriptional regulator
MIQSVHRAIQILGLFSFAVPRLGISEISRSLGLAKGTVQNLVRTLTQEGFLQQDEETRRYQLGLKIYELGITLAGSLEINQKASTPAHQLAQRTQRLVRIAILDNDSALVTLDAYPRSQPFLFRQFGPRAPLYCTALGKALLAYWGQDEYEAYLKRVELIPYTSNTITEKNHLLSELRETRLRGYSINREEHFLARAAIGAPIFGRAEYPAASMCIIVDPKMINGEKTEELAKDVLRTAYEISQLMGSSHRPMLKRDGSGT